MGKPVTIERIKRALVVVAQLVVDDPVYLPIFERLEDELAKAEAERDAIGRAREIIRKHKAGEF